MPVQEFENLKVMWSYFAFEGAKTIKKTQSIHWNHTLDGLLTLFRLVGFFLRPQHHEALIESGIPVIAIGDDRICSFPLHDHAIDKKLEGALELDKFGHDSLINLIDPVGNLLFIVGVGSKDGVNDIEDHFIAVLDGEADLFHLFGHLALVGLIVSNVKLCPKFITHHPSKNSKPATHYLNQDPKAKNRPTNFLYISSIVPEIKNNEEHCPISLYPVRNSGHSRGARPLRSNAQAMGWLYPPMWRAMRRCRRRNMWNHISGLLSARTMRHSVQSFWALRLNCTRLWVRSRCKAKEAE